MGTQDADLIQRWQRGDAGAFEALVRRWQQPLGAFLFRLVGRPEVAQDLCQEVFLRVYQCARQYREAGHFSTWLYQIALNAARDHGRRQAREPLPLGDHEPADKQASVDVRCFQAELTQTVAQCVAELPAPLREVLVLRHYESLNFEEIARITGTPASTLKSRFAVALARLRGDLRERGWGPEEIEE